MARLELPTKEHELVDALERELQPGETEMNTHLVTWRIIDAYMGGIRKFKVMDRWSGHVSIAWENSKGEIEMRFEEIVLEPTDVL